MAELTPDACARLRSCHIAVHRLLHGPVEKVASRWSNVVAEFAALDSETGSSFYQRAAAVMDGRHLLDGAPPLRRQAPLGDRMVGLFAQFIHARAELRSLAHFVPAVDELLSRVEHLINSLVSGVASD